MHQPTLRVLPILAAAACCAGTAATQCTNPWIAEGGGLPGVDGEVFAAIEWDPDGAGPANPLVVVGGTFSVAGSAIASNLAAFDAVTSTWSDLGGGVDGRVRALCVAGTGELVVAGDFLHAGAAPIASIARWNGTAWSALGQGPAPLAHIESLAVLTNGDVVASGVFQTTGPTWVVTYMTRWNGATWLPVPGAPGGSGRMATLPGGGLVVSSLNGLMQWDGATWSSLGSAWTTGIEAIVVRPNGDLVVGGSFSVANGAPADFVAIWNGLQWSPVASGTGGLNTRVRALCFRPNGDLVAAGDGASVALWNGQNWAGLGAGLQGPLFIGSIVYALAALTTGEVVAGGRFHASGLARFRGVARFGGAQWTALGSGTDSTVLTIAEMPNGDAIVGGTFGTIAGVQAAGIARRSGAAWTALGSGVTYPLAGGVHLGAGVYALLVLPNGHVLAAGNFTHAGGQPADKIARWDGSAWSPVGSGLSQVAGWVINTLARMPNGDIIAGGVSGIARWDGTTWSSLGAWNNGSVNKVLVLPNGNLVAAGNGIHVWNGAGWSVLAPNPCGLLAVLPNGDLVAGGDIPISGVSHALARWNGTQWSPMGWPGQGWPAALTRLPNGDLLVGGGFDIAGGGAANNLARWNGSIWSAVGAGTNGGVAAVMALANGDVLIGGTFTTAGNTVAAHIARLTTTCPALATPLGTGCTGSGGANVLTATSLPWIGSTCTTHAVGMPTFGLAVRVLGLATLSTPLAAILPQGGAGCSLLVSPDLLDLHAPVAGAVSPTLTIPNTLALANQTLHQQVVVLELSALGAITALTSTNALTLTIGAF